MCCDSQCRPGTRGGSLPAQRTTLATTCRIKFAIFANMNCNLTFFQTILLFGDLYYCIISLRVSGGTKIGLSLFTRSPLAMLLAVSHLLSLSNRLQNLSITIAALLDNTKPISPPHGMRGGWGEGGGRAKYFIFWPGSNWENISLTDTENFIESFCYPHFYEKTQADSRQM